MSESVNAAKKAPTFVFYLAILTIILMLITSVTMLFNSVTSGTVKQNNLITGAGVFVFSSLLTLVEVILMRRTFNRFGFIFGLGGEITKIILTNTMVKEIDTTIFMALFSATFVSIVLSKFFREKIELLTSSGASKTALQLLPAFIILMVFAGGSIFYSLGISASSQNPNPSFFDTSDINFDLFNVPSWNANYFLDNILDQYLSGLIDPTQIIFNVSTGPGQRLGPDVGLPVGENQPLTYFKLKTYDQYAYDSLKAKTGTFFTSNLDLKILTEAENNAQDYSSINSKPIPGSLEPVDLTVKVPIEYSDSYREAVPIVTNGRTYGVGGGENNDYGPLIDLNTVSVDGQPCTGSLNCNFMENSLAFTNFDDVGNVELSIDGLGKSTSNSVLEYQMKHLLPDYRYISAYSQDVNYYQQVFDNSSWNFIKQTYLQLPNSNDGTLRPGFATYADWAPTTYTLAQSLNQSKSSSVFQRAYSLAAMMNNSLGLKFDKKLWLGEKTGTLKPGTGYPDPDGNIDYVEWFLTNKNGVAAHFASAMTVLLRLQGIPARFVDGYALGNTTMDSSQTVVTSFFKHAWTEVLVPLDTPAGPSFQWVIIDPLLTLPPPPENYLILDPFAYDQSIIFDITDPAYANNILSSIKRVGVDQNDTNNFDNVYDPINDNGIIRSNVFKPSLKFGTVHVGVMFASITYAIGAKDFFMVGIANVPVILQAISNQTKTVRHWLENATDTSNVNFTSGITDAGGIVVKNFTYSPEEHSVGSMSFAIINGTQTIDQCRGQNNEPTCVIAYSDSNRTISPIPLPGFDYLTSFSFNSPSDLFKGVHIDYAVHTLQISSELEFAAMSEHQKPVNDKGNLDSFSEFDAGSNVDLTSILNSIQSNLKSKFSFLNPVIPEQDILHLYFYNRNLIGLLLPSLVGIGIWGTKYLKKREIHQ